MTKAEVSMKVLIMTKVSSSVCIAELHKLAFLAYWPLDHKLLAWPGVGGGNHRRQQFFQPLLLRSYCTKYFKMIYTASLHRGL